MRDHLGNNRIVANQTSGVVQSTQYYPFGMAFADGTGTDKQPYKYNGKELDTMHGLNQYDYSARYYDPAYCRFTTVDPHAEKYYSWSPYMYCYNNPLIYIDPTGMKDTTYVAGRDKPVYDKSGTATPIYNPDGSISSKAKDAYNCHSYAWVNSQGDPKDPSNEYPVSIGVTKWDNDPSNNMEDYIQLDFSDPNQKGDRVIYYTDSNGNGKYDPGENIEHSAIVQTVDKNGYTTTVIGKRGQAGISENHPTAPGYYGTDSNGNPTNRAYFRKSVSVSVSVSVPLPTFLPSLKVETYVAQKNATYVTPPIIIPLRKR